jgi:TetR/AcrR family transcriptional regulator, cholesterol catabolism regulator
MTAVMTTVTKTARRIRHNRTIPREELRQRIFNAAIVLFRHAGYDAVTVEDIARRAGVAKGTLFNFFRSKSDILTAYYEHLDHEFAADMKALNPLEPRAALAAFFTKVERMLLREGELVDAVVRQIALHATLERADLASGVRDRARLADFFRACQSHGTVARGIEAATAGHLVADVWSATVQDWIRRGKPAGALRESLDAKLALLWRGLAP